MLLQWASLAIAAIAATQAKPGPDANDIALSMGGGEGDDAQRTLQNLSNYYCGTNKRDAAQRCFPCPSGSFTDCEDFSHGCFSGVTCASSSSAGAFAATSPYTRGGNALLLASDLRVFVNMQDNFDHGADCSMGDWGLCHTQTLIFDHLGDEAYLDK